MNFKFYHNNINVLDLEKSLKFYKEALNLTEVRRIEAEDKSFNKRCYYRYENCLGRAFWPCFTNNKSEKLWRGYRNS